MSPEDEPLVPADELTHLSGEVYLDYAGAGIYCQSQARAAYTELAEGKYGNPHSINERGAHSRKKIEELRERILTHFNVDNHAYSVVLTSGATGALQLLGNAFPFEAGSVFGVHEHNHNSVLGIRKCCARHGGAYRCFAKDAFPEAPLDTAARALLAAPLVCNFGGLVVDLSWCGAARARGWHTLVDAAGAFGKMPVDLSAPGNQPDFLVASFYKAVGLPTGLGFMLVRRGCEGLLAKGYFGGGTIEAISAEAPWEVLKDDFAERFEDGTLPFLDVPAALHGIAHLERLGVARIEQRMARLTTHLVKRLSSLRHANGRPLCLIYGHDDRHRYCGNVAFGVLDASGGYIGYNTVVSAANVHRISLRGGCFCNPGACHSALGLTVDDVKRQRSAGHVCGDSLDVVDGRPTGATRASLGPYSTAADVDALARFLETQFAVGVPASRTDPAEILPSPVSSGRDGSLGTTTSDDERTPSAVAYTVDSIHIYPVKGARGVAVEGAWPITPSGLLFDRTWCVVKDHPVKPRVVTKMAVPQLGDLQPFIDVHAAALVLFHVPTRKYTRVPLFDKPCGHDAPASTLSSIVGLARSYFQGEAESSVKTVEVRGRKGEVERCSDAVNTWLNDTLGTQGLALCRTGTSSLSNTSDFLIINRASVAELARQVPPPGWGGDSCVFRANIVVGVSDGDGSAWAEDNFEGLTVDGLRLTGFGPCERCGTVNLNPLPPYTSSAEREPLKTLLRIRSNKGKSYFGVTASVSAETSSNAPAPAAALAGLLAGAAATYPSVESMFAGGDSFSCQPSLKVAEGPHFTVGGAVAVDETSVREHAEA